MSQTRKTAQKIASSRYVRIFRHTKTSMMLVAISIVGISSATSYALLREHAPTEVALEPITVSATADTSQVQSAYTQKIQAVGKKIQIEQAKKKLEAEVVQAQALASATAPGPVVVAPIEGQVRGASLYVDPMYQNRPAAIASHSVARWFGGWNNPADAGTLVSAATAQNQLATIVVYNIPVRDCGSYSAGGANSSENYRSWIRQLASAIGQRKAIIIMEPDALPGISCLSNADQEKRLSDISDAVSVFATQTKANVYLDAGNYSWQNASTMIDRLKRANVASATGFSLNVSGFGWTQDSVRYGDSIASQLGKTYVLDTSRNGNGPAPGNEWCNPRGRALGERPTTSPVSRYADAYLWIKVPGESDGTCNGGPSAGTWWQEYADELIRNAGL